MRPYLSFLNRGNAGLWLVLMLFVPAYSWFASRVDRMRLIVGVTSFFIANIVAFALAWPAGMTIDVPIEG